MIDEGSRMEINKDLGEEKKNGNRNGGKLRKEREKGQSKRKCKAVS
jgi:hypothetical protein